MPSQTGVERTFPAYVDYKSRNRGIEMATGWRRLTATAMGLVFPDGASYRELRDLIDRAKAKKNDSERLGRQQSRAREWELDAPVGADSFELYEILRDFLVTRAWVYTVARKAADTRWRFQAESRLDEATVNAIAREFIGSFGTPDSLTAVQAEEGDLWFVVGPKAAESPEFTFVAERLGRSAPAKSGQRTERVLDALPAPAKPVPDAGAYSRHLRRESPARVTRPEAKRSGCFGMIMGVTLLGLLIAWLVR